MHTETKLGFEVRLDDGYERALERVIAALKEQGFGILTRIDLHDALREKIGVEFRDYAILGACNPRLAHRVISAHPEVGMLLPCNVTVEADPEGGTTVRITDPAALFSASGIEQDDTIAGVVAEAHGLLANVAATLSEG
jgi:uncharacterized protein (DUF302 family)